MNKVDAHLHVTADGKWYGTNYDSSLNFTLKMMDAAGIQQAVAVPLPGINQNAFMAELQKSHGDRFFSLGIIDPKSVDSDLQEILDLGLSGIKLHPRLQHQTIKSWADDGTLTKLSEKKLPILICGWSQSSKVPIAELSPLIIDSIAKQFPKITFVIAHMGGHFFWDAVFCARSNPNVYLDCSYFLNFFEGTSYFTDFWKVLNKIDQKVLYGSDSPEVDLLAHAKSFEQQITGQSEVTYSQVWGGNALNVYRGSR